MKLTTSNVVDVIIRIKKADKVLAAICEVCSLTEYSSNSLKSRYTIFARIFFGQEVYVEISPPADTHLLNSIMHSIGVKGPLNVTWAWHDPTSQDYLDFEWLAVGKREVYLKHQANELSVAIVNKSWEVDVGLDTMGNQFDSKDYSVTAAVVKQLNIDEELANKIISNERYLYSNEEFQHLSQFQDVIFQTIELSALKDMARTVELTKTAISDLDPYVLLEKRGFWNALTNSPLPIHDEFFKKLFAILNNVSQTTRYYDSLSQVKQELEHFIITLESELERLAAFVNVLSELLRMKNYTDAIENERVSNRLDNLSLLQTTATLYPNVLQSYINNIDDIQSLIKKDSAFDVDKSIAEFRTRQGTSFSETECEDLNDLLLSMQKRLGELNVKLNKRF